MKKAVLLTSMPSPYMVELVDTINSTNRWHVSVLYCRDRSVDRLWQTPALKHSHVILEHNLNKHIIEEHVVNSDLVVTGTLWGQEVDAVLRAQKKLSTPLVLWCERPGALHRGRVHTLIRRLLINHRYRHSQSIWGIGTWALDEYKRCLPKIKKLGNMPYASDLAPYFNIQRRMPTKPLRILYSGALSERKGVDLLIQTAIKLQNEGSNFSLSLVGHGELTEALKNLVPTTLADKIKFLGFRGWSELPATYQSHDLLVAPSRYDGWGLIVMEGLAAGMPVIATDMMGSALDYIKNGENGWIIPADDKQALLNALKNVANTPLEIIETMGRTARGSVKNWSIDKAASHWCDLADAALK